MPRQRRGIRGDVGIATYAPPTEIPCVTFGRSRPVRPYTRLPHPHFVLPLSFRASARREASALGVHTGAGIRTPRPLPLPLGEVAERSEDGEGKQTRAALLRPFFLRNLK